MDDDALSRLIQQLTEIYGPLIGPDQAAAIAHRKKQTIYDWSSRGKLDGVRVVKMPGPIVLSLDGYVRLLDRGI